MRAVAYLASFAALGALGLALGLWLREPNLGGLVFLLLLVAVAGLLIRQLFRAPVAKGRAAAAEPLRPPEPEPALWEHDYPRVDVNAAGLDELQRLPGVGPVAARRILDEREANGPFETVEALTRVPGFGPAKVRVLAPDARCGPPAPPSRGGH